jgi:polyphosphate glucokinase
MPNGAAPVTTAIGVDVGGSGIKGAIVDVSTGTAGERIRVATPQPATPDAVTKVIADVVGDLAEQPGGDAARSGPIGCTLPAVVMHGVVRTAAHIDPSWIGTDAAAVLSAALARRCAVLNDADAAGLAEVRFGAARGVSGLVVMVTLGTGLGTALINDGVLLANSELGHLEIDGHNADDWASDAARENEDLGWKDWTKRLNRYLEHLHALVWPDVIVLGGGVVKHADKFLDRLDPGCELRVAQLGNLAGIVGAACAATTTP